MVSRIGQMKIMQMSFMIIGVFLFFILVGLFVLGIMLGDIRGSAEELAREEAISSLETIASMSEFSYNSDWSMAVDEDKLDVFASGVNISYEELWPFASLKFYKVYPVFDEAVKCPSANCNYYEVYNSGQQDVESVSSYVSICKKVREVDSTYNRCEVGKIVVGVKKLGGDFDEV